MPKLFTTTRTPTPTPTPALTDYVCEHCGMSVSDDSQPSCVFTADVLFIGTSGFAYAEQLDTCLAAYWCDLECFAHWIKERIEAHGE